MATKERTEESSKDRIWVDSQGLVLILVAVVLVASLVSYDRLDLGVNTTEPNASIRNWMGRFGAHMVYELQLVLGFGTWVLPVIFLLCFLRSLIGLFAAMAFLDCFRGSGRCLRRSARLVRALDSRNPASQKQRA